MAALTMAAKESALSDAPPTSAPSTSSFVRKPATLSGLAEPPYSTRMPSAVAFPKISVSVARMAPQTSWASSAVAVLPVPMAQMGS